MATPTRPATASCPACFHVLLAWRLPTSQSPRAKNDNPRLSCRRQPSERAFKVNASAGTILGTRLAEKCCRELRVTFAREATRERRDDLGKMDENITHYANLDSRILENYTRARARERGNARCASLLTLAITFDKVRDRSPLCRVRERISLLERPSFAAEVIRASSNCQVHSFSDSLYRAFIGTEERPQGEIKNVAPGGIKTYFLIKPAIEIALIETTLSPGKPSR